MNEFIFHSIPDPYSGNMIEVFGEEGMGSYDFRLVKDGRVLYQSNMMYGMAGIALRDALNLFTSDDFQVPA